MAPVIWKDSDPSDPMYSEGPQSYSPHWGRKFLQSKTPSPPSTPLPTALAADDSPDGHREIEDVMPKELSLPADSTATGALKPSQRSGYAPSKASDPGGGE